MPDTTTLVCLFHHEDVAQAALKDLMDAGIPADSVSMIDNDGPREENSGATLEQLGVPARDQQHLLDGVGDGGVIVAVSAMTAHQDTVEGIFKKHSATKIDEMDRDTATPLASNEDEELVALPVTLVDDATDVSDPSQLGDVRTLRMYRTVGVVPEDELVELDNENRRDL